MKKHNQYVMNLLFVGCIGAVAMIAQISYVRLSALSFYGNELTFCVVLGHWLLCAGIGSIVGSSLITRVPVRKTLLLISYIYAGILIVFLYALFLVRKLAGIHTSEVVGFGSIFIYTFILLAIPSFLNGLFFPFLIAHIKQQNEKYVVQPVYSAEVFGSAAGSLIFAGFIYLGLNTLVNLHLILAVFLVLVSLTLIVTGKWKFISATLSVILMVFLMIFCEKPLLDIKWRPFQVEKFTESPYLSLTTVNYQRVYTLYADSEPLWTFGEREKAEELVHFGLLGHSNPESILIIGIANSEVIREVVKHPSVKEVTVYQQDSFLQEQLNIFAPVDSLSFSVNYVIDDPVSALRRSGSLYDVIILNIPTPVNAQWNRFYTVEFFRLAHRAVASEGILVLHFPGGESFLTEEHIDFLKTMYNTVKLVFENATWIPGEMIHLIASDFPINNDYESIVGKLRDRNIKNVYVQDYYLYDRLSPMKVNFLESQIEQCKTRYVNLITSPVGYYYDTILWDQQTGGILRHVYKFLRSTPSWIILGGIVAILIILIIHLKSRRKSISLIHFNMASVGFIVMSLETVLIIIFQSYVGAVYLRIVFLIFSYMLGSGIGALLHLKFYKVHKFSHLISQLILLSFLPLVIIIMLIFNPSSGMMSSVVLIVLFLSGIIGGIVFPILSLSSKRITDQSIAPAAGRVYAWDIFGASLGAYLISGIIIPIWGIYVTLIFLLSICFVTLFGNMFFRQSSL